MLNLDTALQLHGLTIYRDFNSQNRFWYMPNAPHLTREAGQPLFQLLIYREDIAERPEFTAGERDGGGFLTMTVDLGVPESTLNAVRRELEGRVSGEVDLVPVPFERGTVRVSALGASAGAAPGLAGEDEESGGAPRAGFVEQILGSSVPSLYNDNRAVFSLELSKRGALLMKVSIESGGASQIAVVYNLDYKGLLPARECRITIDFRQSYQHLRARTRVNTLWFKADIDAEMERLIKEGHITIEDVDYLGLEPAALAERATALQTLAKELATWSFFAPGLQPGQVLAQDRGELEVYDPTQDATAATAGFTTPLDLFVGGSGRTDDGPAVVSGASETSGGVRGTATAPPPAAESEEPRREREPTAVERWNRAGRPQVGFLLRSLSQEEQQTITFDLRQVSAQQRTAAPQSSIRFAAGDADLAGRIEIVDLNHPFFDVVSGTVTSTADFEGQGVRSMVVKVRYGEREDGTRPKDTKEFPITAPGTTGSYAFHLDHRLGMELEYQVVIGYKAGFALGDDSPEAVSPWVRTTTRNLDVDPRIVGAAFPVTLTVGQVDWGSVRSIQAEVTYEDAAAGLSDSATRVLSQDAQTTVVPIRPKAGGSTKFRVAATYFYESAREGPVVYESDGAQLVVLNQPPTSAVPVAVSLVDPLDRIRKVVVELAYGNQRGTVELTGEGASGAWTFFRENVQADPRYTHRVTVFAKDGTTRRLPEVEAAERQLIVGDVVEGIHEVEVRILAPDLAQAGFALARLRLEYPDAPDWADRASEHVFEGTPQPFTWRVPKARGGGSEYTYRMEWFKTDGTRTVIGPETVQDEVLILIPPATT
jgi:hypothetical protein